MGDTFVDVAYRGLELGKRVKLRDVRPELGYIDHPLPMPVGTRVEILADEGLTIAAVVVAVHEQVAGDEPRPPGMRVKPALDATTSAWWQARVDAAAMAAEADAAQAAAAAAQAAAQAEAAALEAAQAAAAQAAAAQAAAATDKNAAAQDAPEVADPDAAVFARKDKGKKPNGKAGSRATVVMSAELVEEAVRASLVAPDASAGDSLHDDGRRTEAMAAVDPVELERAAAAGAAAPVVVDGKATQVMSAIDISMITGEPSAEIGVGAVEADEDSAEITIDAPDGDADEGASKSGKTATDGRRQAQAPARRQEALTSATRPRRRGARARRRRAG